MSLRVAKVFKSGNCQIPAGHVAYLVEEKDFKDRNEAVKHCKETAPNGSTEFQFVNVGRNFLIEKAMQPTTSVVMGESTIKRKKKVSPEIAEMPSVTNTDVGKSVPEQPKKAFGQK